MQHWTHDIQSWLSHALVLVAANPEWALLIAFLASIIEAVAIIGTFVPGTFILMGVAGAAAASGQPMLPFLAVAIAGAVTGDFLSYWVGHHYRFTIRAWRPLARRPWLTDGADRFFARYGAWSVALCRFVPVLRSMVPLVAGISGLETRRFLIANVASACVWAPSHVWPAQAIGVAIHRLLRGDWLTAALLGAAVLAGGIGAWLLHRRLAVSRHDGRPPDQT